MRLGQRVVTVLLTAAAAGCIPPPGGARSAERPRRVFACSLGRKSVSVTSLGHRLTYTFGTPGHTEISITGSAGQGNVLHYGARYAGLEDQVRFVSGQYSYVAYSMEGNSSTDSSPVSGLIVLKGDKVAADMPCTRYAEFSGDFDLDWLPADTEQYSAMSVDPLDPNAKSPPSAPHKARRPWHGSR